MGVVGGENFSCARWLALATPQNVVIVFAQNINYISIVLSSNSNESCGSRAYSIDDQNSIRVKYKNDKTIIEMCSLLEFDKFGVNSPVSAIPTNQVPDPRFF